ncbi:hypothetical protein AAON49_10165 [Pseudotenacibaculum sp. MALMAid0570]|uniref:hypothetical protein n=1 Tax=Pseudotenacibaculum sp. MALMAid0570 TaxID=3143938 RepID=UPI0032DF1333
MSKYKNLKTNSSQNFILKGFNSIQIGLYIVLGAYLFKLFLQGFLSDDSLLGMMSIEIIEMIGLGITSLVFILSALAIFFSNRRRLRKTGNKVWNSNSKKHFLKFFLTVVVGIVVLTLFQNLGFTAYLAPFLLTFFALLLLILNSKKKQAYYFIAIIGFVLAILSILIPSYWYSSLLIVGATFFVYGVVVKE